MSDDGLRICHVGSDGGLLLPLFSNENDWPTPLRALLYMLGMVYCFLGVSIIADIFMDSITVITTRRRKVRLDDNRVHTKKVWNDTVATLSLMALGSSAPEICLSMIELTKREMHVGKLGPSTIVGSAAFNLLVIVGVCILAIPSTEGRRIQELPVFYVTALFSVLAYVWLAFILTISSADIVDIWEAAVTLLMLPGLIYISWKTDTGELMKVVNRCLGRSNQKDDDSSSGEKCVLSFNTPNFTVKRQTQEFTIEVLVSREGDVSGKASCSFRTERYTAVPEFDFVHDEGTLVFEPGVEQQGINIQLKPNAKAKGKREFLVVLVEPQGADFNAEDDGGEEAAICSVLIEPPSDRSSVATEALVNKDALHLGLKDWARQTWSSLYVNGSAEEQRNASFGEWMSHVVCLPWKLLFLAVPPLSLFGGWCCFYGSLAMIACLTAALSDLAELFGCVCDIPDIITALIFVALGTSMPDLFASLSAARVDPTADASIVNVTGSNGVNVFLGLGLPWTAGAIYWAIQGPNAEWESRYSTVVDGKVNPGSAAFVVDSTNLGFSVLGFSAACVEALILLFLRRRFIGAELGGPMIPKVATVGTFFLMWLGYSATVSWRVLRWEKFADGEETLVMGGVCAFEVVLGVITAFLIIRYGKDPDRHSQRGKATLNRPQLATHRSGLVSAATQERARSSSRNSFSSNGDGSVNAGPTDSKGSKRGSRALTGSEDSPSIEAERYPEVINSKYLTGASVRGFVASV